MLHHCNKRKEGKSFEKSHFFKENPEVCCNGATLFSLKERGKDPILGFAEKELVSLKQKTEKQDDFL